MIPGHAMQSFLRKLYRRFFLRTRGVVDSWANGKCTGWAIDTKSPGKTARVSLVVDGKIVKTVTANLTRADLAKGGYKTTEHGFSFALPEEIFLQPKARCQLIIDGDGKLLFNGEFSYTSGMKLPPSLLHLYSETEINALVEQSRSTALDMVVTVRGVLPESCSSAILYAINADKPFEYVRATCREFKNLGYAVVLINSRPGAERYDNNYDGFSDLRIYKKDWGRDFASWLTGYHHIAQSVPQMDHLVFINDSIIGPLSSIADMLKAYSASQADFWALTDSYDQTYHYQSSLFILSGTALSSRGWQLFVANYDYPNDKDRVIAEGELGLSTILFADGVRSDVLCPYHEVAAKWAQSTFRRNRLIYEIDKSFQNHTCGQFGYAHHTTAWFSDAIGTVMVRAARNAQHTFWDTLILDYGYPFLKKELYLFNPEKLPNLTLVLDHVPAAYKSSATSIFLDITRRTGEGRIAPPILPEDLKMRKT
jgi:hypothetical protein